MRSFSVTDFKKNRKYFYLSSYQQLTVNFSYYTCRRSSFHPGCHATNGSGSPEIPISFGGPFVLRSNQMSNRAARRAAMRQTSEAQLAANRANAQSSSGPKTEQGKLVLLPQRPQNRPHWPHHRPTHRRRRRLSNPRRPHQQKIRPCQRHRTTPRPNHRRYRMASAPYPHPRIRLLRPRPSRARRRLRP